MHKKVEDEEEDEDDELEDPQEKVNNLEELVNKNRKLRIGRHRGDHPEITGHGKKQQFWNKHLRKEWESWRRIKEKMVQ